MQDKEIAIVVGGSAGIGLGLAEGLSANGYHVITLSRSAPSSSQLAHVRVDLENQDEARKLIRTVVDQYHSRLAGLFYSAVFYGPGRQRFVDTDTDYWKRTFDVNVGGLALILRELLPKITARRSRPAAICGISSEVALNHGPGRAAYAASKAAAGSLLRSLAHEFDASDIVITQALPAGMVDTRGIRERRPPDFDYSEYAHPASFIPFALYLTNNRPTEMHGREFVIAPNGSWAPVEEAHPASQSRSLT